MSLPSNAPRAAIARRDPGDPPPVDTLPTAAVLGPVAAPDDAVVAAAQGEGRRAAGWIPLVLVGLVLGWAYAPNLRGLIQVWWDDPNYTHGFLVAPIALLILWRRRALPDGPPARPGGWGWAVVAAALVGRAACYERGMLWLETATLLPVIAGLTGALGGGALLRRAWPAVAYLAFMLPLPARLNGILALSLQRLATTSSCALVRLSGLWVMSEGNVLVLGPNRLEVANVCNGLSMLISLAALITAAILLVPLAAWKRVVLFLSIIPIALFSNVLRITATAWCYHQFGATVGERYAHDAAGWLMMPLALVLLGLELKGLSWLILEEAEPPRPLGGLVAPPARPGSRPLGTREAGGPGPYPGPTPAS